MIFTSISLEGAFLLDVEPHCDDRGFFARSWCHDEFTAHGLNAHLAQCSISRNRLKGTLRGMHYQASPHGEVKLIRCTMGAIYDVIVDLRRGSPTRFSHFGAILSAENHRALYVPEGFAHGFLTLENDSEVFYQISEIYHPDAARGVRWNDPAFGINWPDVPVVISDRDATYPDVDQIAGGY